MGSNYVNRICKRVDTVANSWYNGTKRRIEKMNLNSPDPTANPYILDFGCCLSFGNLVSIPRTRQHHQNHRRILPQSYAMPKYKTNLPIGLAVCIAWHESSYKPTAQSRYVGGYRSRGLMQIYHKYQEWNCQKYTDIPPKLFDWKNPIHLGTSRLRIFGIFDWPFPDGDLYLAVLAYNWGEGNVSALLTGGLTENDIPAHCANYAKNVLWMLDNTKQEQLWVTNTPETIDQKIKRYLPLLHHIPVFKNTGTKCNPTIMMMP